MDANSNQEVQGWRRTCGCLRTSDKLKHLLQSFPAPPPPSTVVLLQKDGGFGASINNLPPKFIAHDEASKADDHAINCISGKCMHVNSKPLDSAVKPNHANEDITIEAGTSVVKEQSGSRAYRVTSELVSLVQLSVTATALAVYYLLYCYMQLVYYSLRSVLYFHNADGPMKVTIGVVVFTSVVIGFNVILRMERIAGFGSTKTC